MMVTLDDAYSRQASITVLQALRDALALVHAQFSPWTVDFSEHAVGLESHHILLFNANVAVGKLQNKILVMDKETILLRIVRALATTLPAKQ